MLYNTYAFIFAFLPFTLLGFALLERVAPGRSSRVWWLVACSVLFYSIWNPTNLLIIAPSIAVNFAIARAIQSRVQARGDQDRWASILLVIGLVFNLSFLGYFKYRNFFLDSFNHLTGSQFPLAELLLPLGISFITFQKIAFLVDVRLGSIRKFDVLDFLIFVFFFPQLIAGPIVHYREMVPQFRELPTRLRLENLGVGISLFAIGLFKKVVLADGIAPYVSSIFESAERGEPLGLATAWLGTCAFTLQVYYDFSGYSDMATGLARMFGIKLPVNFDSPLKASSIIDFWARWHITLTRFLTAYVYSPISVAVTRRRMEGGKSMVTRKQASLGAFAVLVAFPTVATMFVSGLWHGAGITFVLYGVLHGAYLVVNHAWRQWRPKWDRAAYDRIMRPLGSALTLACAFFAMALFRSSTLHGALHMMGGMLGFQGVILPSAVLSNLGPLGGILQATGVTVDFMSSGTLFAATVLWSLGLLTIALSAPNSLQMLASFDPAVGLKSVRRPLAMVRLSPGWAVLFGVWLLAGLLGLNRPSEFLYWQF